MSHGTDSVVTSLTRIASFVIILYVETYTPAWYKPAADTARCCTIFIQERQCRNELVARVMSSLYRPGC